jgi:hypothetical protein
MLSFLVLIEVRSNGLGFSSDGVSGTSSDDDASKEESGTENIETLEIESIPSSSPPPPSLPLMELDIRFVINGKESGERSTEVDVNKDLVHFKSVLIKYIMKVLPGDLRPWGPDVKIVYQRAYITKAQARKPKTDMPWKAFEDDGDYAGLLNAIQSESKPSKMVIVMRVFLTIPQDKFEEVVEPELASRRTVCLYWISTANCRLSHLSKRRP